jgi:quinohemoprotein ethanol dehydrogenase
MSNKYPSVLSHPLSQFFSLLFALNPPTAFAAGSEHTQGSREREEKNWLMVGGNQNNTRYSALPHINTDNVQQLGAAWVSERFDEGGTSHVTPVVKDGVMFVSAGRKVYALNARTGENIWSYKTVPDTPNRRLAPTSEHHKESTPSPSAVPNRRGVAVGQGLVFVGLQDGHVIAISEQTGNLVWARQTGIDQPKKEQMVSAAPTYIDGVVFAGLSNGDARLRGRLTALEAGTGKQLWQFLTIPSPGEAGHKTWPSFNDAWKFGGGGVWTNAAVDPELGTVYVATGNAVPTFAGDWRPGDNLYTCSVLAIDTLTGKLKWHYQLVHHDVFDADAGTPVILYDAKIEGRMRKAVAVLRADGYLFQLDRRTGKPLLPVAERSVPQLGSQRTSPTQPFPVGGESILMSCEDWKRHGIPAGFVLGCMWTAPASSEDPQNVLAPFPSVRLSSMAFSAQTGYFYAQSASFLTWPRRSPDPYYLDFNRSVPGLKTYGTLAAIDSRTGTIAWTRPIYARSDGLPFFRSGLLATAGGLTFRSSADGFVEANDAKTGDVLWKFQTGMVGDTGSPVSYEVDGEQYIAVPMSTTVWAFKLGGKLSAAATPAVSGEEGEFFGPVIDTSEIETTALKYSALGPGKRYFIDEYAFNPYRARVKARTKVLFVNNGSIRHEVVAVDGSWGSGPLSPTQEAWITFDAPGQYTYICKDHPWAYGQIIVTPPISVSQ